jgi:hypothetical protein
MNTGRAERRRKQSFSPENEYGRPPLIGRILISARDLQLAAERGRRDLELAFQRHLASIADFCDARGSP